MKKEGFYSSGEFAKMAQVTVRTIRYYDRQNILKPSYVTPAGARFYTDEDFARLQQILLLKYLGFSLEDIRDLTVARMDPHQLSQALQIQLKLVRDKIEQMQLVEQAVARTLSGLETDMEVNWNGMLELIHLTGMEKAMKNQYLDATNISSRIQLHKLYSLNRQGWFPWLYEKCAPSPGMRILELGCGDGSLWAESLSRLPEQIRILLTDISNGMLRDARRQIGAEDPRFEWSQLDCRDLSFPPESFEMVIANHVLFYCDDLPRLFGQVRSVLTQGGRFLCSTYGPRHMQEVTWLVKGFDERISLAATQLFERFGAQNGYDLLSPWFKNVRWYPYEDSLNVTSADPLISYILSCHGNQNQYILERYQDFRTYVRKKIGKGYRITKEAGVFICSDE